jgi:catechol 2,3-dioxygenase-like lactoylglutathione lyase family enzyme
MEERERLLFEHIHLISRDPAAAAEWYCRVLGGAIAGVQPALRGAPQIDVRVGGATILIRGRRPGEEPQEPGPLRPFDGYSSHERWGVDHFGLTYRGDLRAFCSELKRRGARLAVEPWEFAPGVVLCYVAAPDGVSIELVEKRG